MGKKDAVHNGRLASQGSFGHGEFANGARGFCSNIRLLSGGKAIKKITLFTDEVDTTYSSFLLLELEEVLSPVEDACGLVRCEEPEQGVPTGN